MAKKSKKISSRLAALDKGRGSSAPIGPRANEEPPLDASIFILTALLPFVLLVGLAIFFGERKIEGYLEDQTAAALAAAVPEEVEFDIAASGLDVSVEGAVPREELLASIPEFLLANVQGLRSVEADLRYSPPVIPADIVVASDPLIVTWEGGDAVVTGTLSDEATLDAVNAALTEIFPSIDVAGLSVKPGVASERDWLGTVVTLIREMQRNAEMGEVLANPEAGLVRVSAEFESRQERSDVRGEVEDILAAVTFDFVSGLTVKDAPPPPKVEQVVELQEDLDELIEGKVVEFERDSDVITPVGQALLDEILEALRKFPDVPIEIGGHTDAQGSDEYNLDLSRRRAEAVLGYLVANGEAQERFIVMGYGEAQPIADNETPEGQARNRRIEFTALEE